MLTKTMMTMMSLMTMEYEDPWKTIVSTRGASQINARRIPDAGKGEWAFYWGIDAENKCLLVLQLNENSVSKTRRLPTLKGLIDRYDRS